MVWLLRLFGTFVYLCAYCVLGLNFNSVWVVVDCIMVGCFRAGLLSGVLVRIAGCVGVSVFVGVALL